jgi:hypothetical protein
MVELCETCQSSKASVSYNSSSAMSVLPPPKAISSSSLFLGGNSMRAFPSLSLNVRQNPPFLDADLPSSICHYLSTIDGSLHIPAITSQLPQPLQIGDECSIDTFLPMKLRRTVFKSCQRVQRYLGITYLSEITTADCP